MCIRDSSITNSGGITELALAFAGNSNDKFYFGGTIGIPFLNYNRESSFTEADASTNTNNNFDYASISENLNTSGIGINLKMGIIIKLKNIIALVLRFTNLLFNL